MRFNASKFKWLQLSRNQEIMEDYFYLAAYASNPILPTDEVRDLGIMMNNCGDYSNQVEYICKKVNKKIGWILRNFNNRKVDFMRFLWKVYITPVMDYCSQLYAPSFGRLLMKLENLLKSFSKKVSGLSHLNYWERINILKLYSVGRRNER